MINKNNIDASELRDSLVRVYREDLPEGARFNLQISVVGKENMQGNNLALGDFGQAIPERDELTYADVLQAKSKSATLEPAYRHDIGGTEACYLNGGW